MMDPRISTITAPPLLAAALAAVLAIPGAVPAQGTTADSQDRGTTIETAPLAPIRPRLPGGTVIAPGDAGENSTGLLPGGVAPPPGTEEDRIFLPGGIGPEARDDGAPSDGETVSPLPNDAEEDDLATLEEEGGLLLPPTDTLLPVAPEGSGEDADPVLEDLFKRAPPGTGGLAPEAPQPIEPVARKDEPGAVIRQLDKLTGRIDTFEMSEGEEVQVDRLRITLGECRAPVDGAASDNIAFLTIWDTKNAEAEAVFTGWMFADSPALSAMDHPRYDVWLIRCKTATGSSSAANE